LVDLFELYDDARTYKLQTTNLLSIINVATCFNS